MTKFFIKIFGVTLLAVCLLAACSEETVKKEVPQTETKEVKQKEQEENPEKEVKEESKDESKKDINAHKIGDTVNAGGIKVTLTSIEPYKGEMKQFHPILKDHAVKIIATIENTTDSKVHVDLYEFKMYDVEGTELQPAMPAGITKLSDELAPGKKMEIAIYFDVPDQEGVWKVRYWSYSTGASATWEVPAK
ncbi:DUF4352 domain-containing protein [Virgibacillus flavescens]|uniref:DUF4352 domain-containing protein n=1 Tax=Virgibacillus flavescens TaxID=1611422 RepID=UPI003D34B91B